MRKSLILTVLVMLSLTVFAENMDVLNRAITKIDVDKNRFSYMSTVEKISKDKKDIQLVSHDPNSDPVEQLLKVNDEEPSKKEIKKFYKERENQGSDDAKTSDILGDNYTLVSQEDGIAQYMYTTYDIIPKKEVAMKGQLWLDLNSETITKITIENLEKVPVAIGVKLTTFYMELNFIPYDDNTSIATKMIMNIVGKAVAFEFEQGSTSTLYDYIEVN